MSIPTGLTQIGCADWTADEMRASLQKFSDIYARRPILDNYGGMSSAHLFLLWFMLRRLAPTTVIENGVWHGQGTWLIEQAVPDARIECIDIDWSNIVYRSPNATYSSTDFVKRDWSALDKRRTVVFFDDHVDAVRRTKQAQAAGFVHLIFEDNYFPNDVSDFYTLKLALADAGYRPKKDIRYIGGLLKGTRSDWPVKPNTTDSAWLHQAVDIYAEQPPVFRLETTRWGTQWDMPTPEPLLRTVEEPWQQVFLDEAKWYTWMAYLRLKQSAG